MQLKNDIFYSVQLRWGKLEVLSWTHTFRSFIGFINTDTPWFSDRFVLCSSSGMRCHVLPLIPQGRYSCTQGFVVDSRCEFTCDPGFRIQGQHSRTCQHGGSWTGGQPDCLGTSPILCTWNEPHGQTQKCLVNYSIITVDSWFSSPSITWTWMLSISVPVQFPISLSQAARPSVHSHHNKHHFLLLCSLDWSQTVLWCLFIGCSVLPCVPVQTNFLPLISPVLFLPFKLFLSDTDPPKIRCPPSRLKVADPGKLTARVTWDPPTAKDTADKSLE